MHSYLVFRLWNCYKVLHLYSILVFWLRNCYRGISDECGSESILHWGPVVRQGSGRLKSNEMSNLGVNDLKNFGEMWKVFWEMTKKQSFRNFTGKSEGPPQMSTAMYRGYGEWKVQFAVRIQCLWKRLSSLCFKTKHIARRWDLSLYVLLAHSHDICWGMLRIIFTSFIHFKGFLYSASSQPSTQLCCRPGPG